MPPLVSFVTWNRAGTNIRNLMALLDTTDDFDLHIIDNNSQDDTWKFITGIKDYRIKSKTRFAWNRGLLYALNYTMSKRKKNQFFITLDSDICILTKDWITKFMEVMDTYPNVGYIGVINDVEDYIRGKEEVPINLNKNNVSFYPYKAVWGGCCCLRPEVIELVGYWNEETGRADSDMCKRINDFTPYSLGYVPSIQMEYPRNISCQSCLIKDTCTLRKIGCNCFNRHDEKYKHPEFAAKMAYKENIFIRDIISGKRSVYCASIHDQLSRNTHYYNEAWANENFRYFIENAN